MNLSFQERYQAGDSPLHRLDPRVKLATTLLMILGIVLTPERAGPAYPLLWSLVASLAMIGGPGAWRLAKLGGVAFPFALAAITLPFTVPGEPLFTVLGLTASDAGTIRFVSIVLKSWLAVQVALLLAMTTHFTDLLWAMENLRIPGTLVAIVGFMYRYLFTLKDEAERLLRARSARSGSDSKQKPGGRILWRARVAGGMIGNLFLRSYERSERVYSAMLARGYTGHLQVPKSPPLTWGAIFQGAAPLTIVLIIEILAVLWWR